MDNLTASVLATLESDQTANAECLRIAGLIVTQMGSGYPDHQIAQKIGSDIRGSLRPLKYDNQAEVWE